VRDWALPRPRVSLRYTRGYILPPPPGAELQRPESRKPRAGTPTSIRRLRRRCRWSVLFGVSGEISRNPEKKTPSCSSCASWWDWVSASLPQAGRRWESPPTDRIDTVPELLHRPGPEIRSPVFFGSNLGTTLAQCYLFCSVLLWIDLLALRPRVSNLAEELLDPTE
jgi:hypothetical protein